MIHRRTLFGAVAGLLTTKAKAQTMTDAPIATTAHGRVRGATDQGIHVFKGIPYGATTAGAARFHAPAPAAGWSGIRDALAYPPMAPQSIFAPGSLFASWTFDKAISEDCLALNVWTPGLRDGAKRPVMVWFHGGDFSSLSGSRNVYDGVRLCRRGDVVVVTVNHRLNAFGYMYLAEAAPQLAAAANPGMLDLVAALRWVHENIAEFGGDPGNVTIFGQSGGGGKVSTIMAMPDATGLFHRAIVQSGSYARNAHLQAMSPEEGTRHARTLLAALEIPPGNTDALASLPMDTLVAAVAKVARGPNRAVWRPIADGTVLPAGPWWPDGSRCLGAGTADDRDDGHRDDHADRHVRCRDLHARRGWAAQAPSRLDEARGRGSADHGLPCGSARGVAVRPVLRHRHRDFVPRRRLDTGRAKGSAERRSGLSLRARLADAGG